MRIALVIYGSLETLSGGYLYDRKLAEYLREQGDTVEVASQPWRNYAAHLRQNFDPGLLRRLAAVPFDCVLQDELNHPSLWRLNRQLKRRARYPILSIVHHLRSSEQHPRPLRPFYRAVERAYLRTVDGFIFNSQTTRRSVEGLLGRPACGVVAYPGGDQFGGRRPAGDPEETAHSHDGKYYEGEQPLRLLFVGNLIRRKGLHTLLRALALIAGQNWRLEIVGRGDADPAYTRLAQRLAAPLGERVRFLGRLETGDFQRAWRENQVLVVPSSYEGFGIVYLEGMAFGLPAVASTAGAAGEIVTHGENGLLVPPEDPRALARALSGLISDRQRVSAMSKAARRRFESFPTWRQSAAAAREFICRMAASC